MVDHKAPINVPIASVAEKGLPIGEPESRFKCTECDAEVLVPNDVLPGEILSCPDCGQEYEVSITEGKVKLKLAERLREDWGE